MKRLLSQLLVIAFLSSFLLITGCPSGPKAAFSANPRVGAAPLSAVFTDESTASKAGVTSWFWDFGDGTSSALQNPTHVYSTAGTYDVKLTVTSSNGIDSETKTGYVVADPDGEETILLNNEVPLTMVWVDAGTFNMGASGSGTDNPSHQVTLSHGFWIGKYEITKAQWKAIKGTKPWNSPNADVYQGSDSPAIYISWDDTQSFISALNTATGDTYRLPTEAEWEYAYRANTTTSFYWGEVTSVIGDYAWWGANAEDDVHDVGQKLPNAWGLYDMPGNAWEWCQDWYGAYGAGPDTDPTGPATGTTKIARGGSFCALDAYTCRSTIRNTAWGPAVHFLDFGFRICKD